ncbi:MAG TPA: proline--tRNA ligase, partial [Clostridia bacterium]|nr:proline--tRNA ligase [Clostridia bacterium]
EEAEMEEVYTPGAKTIEKLVDFLKVPASRCLKTMFYLADDQLIAVVIRGDREVNTIKLKNKLECLNLELASQEKVQEKLGLTIGYVGPMGLEGIPIYCDEEASLVSNGVVGANKEDYHLINVNYGRDFIATVIGDFRVVEAGDPCPNCRGRLASARGIEVGQVFKLGTKYSEAMDATFVDESGEKQYIVMGCYGIGITRTLAAAVEQNYDSKGIIWPLSIAPYHVVVIPVSNRDDRQMEIAETIYQELVRAGLEVVFDDRDERAGVKFNDAELIGFPIRITVGKKTLSQGTVDVNVRRGGKEFSVKMNEVCAEVKNLLHSNGL